MDIHQTKQAGVELAAQCALLGDSYDAVIDQISTKVEEAGPAGAGVMAFAIATLAELLNANIPLVEREGLAIRELLRQLATNQPIDESMLPDVTDASIRPSRAERRKKRRK